MSTAYFKVQFGLDFIMKANIMNPEETVHKIIVWSGPILFSTKTFSCADPESFVRVGPNLKTFFSLEIPL